MGASSIAAPATARVVNGNLEDNPFMLANGDVIEIGNTAFRFDHAERAGAPAAVASTFDVDRGRGAVDGRRQADAERAPRARAASTGVRAPEDVAAADAHPSAQPEHVPGAAANDRADAADGAAAGVDDAAAADGRFAPIAAQPQAPTLLASEPHSGPMSNMMPAAYPGQPPQGRPLMAGYPQ